MAATDAKLIPAKNAAYRLYAVVEDATGARVTGGLTGLAGLVDLDGAGTGATNGTPTEIGTTGIVYLDLIAAEMNADAVTVIISSNEGVDWTRVMYPFESGDLTVYVDDISGAAADIRTAVGLASNDLDTQLAALPTAAEIRAEIDNNSTQLAAIVADTDELQTDGIAASIAALENISAAEVNAEVVDALATDAYAELAAVPVAASTLADKINWLFMHARNKKTATATTVLLKADDGSTTVGTSTVSDDGTTFTRGEFA